MRDDAEELARTPPEGFADLRAEAPPRTVERFRSRAAVVRGARFVLKRQIYAFWIVLHTFLKLLFKHVRVPVPAPDETQARRYRRAVKNGKEG